MQKQKKMTFHFGFGKQISSRSPIVLIDISHSVANNVNWEQSICCV